jgi:hypothetical protein
VPWPIRRVWCATRRRYCQGRLIRRQSDHLFVSGHAPIQTGNKRTTDVLHKPDKLISYRQTSSGPWDAFANVDGFVDEVLTELAAMARDGIRPQRLGPKPALTGVALRKAVMAIWCVCFCGMQWRAIGVLSDIPFGTLYGLFARWTRLGLWRRLLDRLRRTWRRACGDAPEPSRGHRQSILSLGTELLYARHRRRQEGPRR